MFVRYPKTVLSFFILITLIGSVLALWRVRFSFDLEDFFPDGDDDLAFFQDFRQKFERDDNFLLIAVRREAGAFDSTFLTQILDVSQRVRDIEFPTTPPPNAAELDSAQLFQRDGKWHLRPIVLSQSLLQVEYPIKTPFSFTTIPAIHLDQPNLYASDRSKALADERLVNTLISKDAKTLVIATKTIEDIQQYDAEQLIKRLHALLESYKFESYHLLGRANFQKEMVEVQANEFLFAVLVSGVLVLLVMYSIFRRFWGVVVSATSILFGIGAFVAVLGIFGARLDTMALLYPIVMIIVATSDVIHVMSKYVDELHKGKPQMQAIQDTMREIGLSVFLTSATTAIGFVSLMSSRIPPIRAFGLYAAIGVMLAYVTVVTFTVAILTLFRKEQIANVATQEQPFWSKLMAWINYITSERKGRVLTIVAASLAICAVGIMQVNTNNKLEGLMPYNQRVTNDFLFFEREFSGFRPLEIAISTKTPYTVDSFAVVQQIDKLEQHLKSYGTTIQSITSINVLYKSMNRAFGNDRPEAYRLPDDAEQFYKYQRLGKRLDKAGTFDVLVSKDNQHARVSARMLDIGVYKIKQITDSIDTWILHNIDTSMVSVRQTGTSIIVDKNSWYVRDSLLYGLLFAVGLIAVIMMFLYRQLNMVFVALIPNIVPLAFAGALLGFLQIPLEGGVSIVFSIIFGIAVDDTIHFLGRFRLLKYEGFNTDEAIRITLLETGKAMCLTTVTLFAGFIVLLFSAMPAAHTVGLLISSTLFTALICDLFLLPVLLRMFIK